MCRSQFSTSNSTICSCLGNNHKWKQKITRSQQWKCSALHILFLNSEAYFDIQLYKPVNKQTSKQTKIKTEYRFWIYTLKKTTPLPINYVPLSWRNPPLPPPHTPPNNTPVKLASPLKRQKCYIPENKLPQLYASLRPTNHPHTSLVPTCPLPWQPLLPHNAVTTFTSLPCIWNVG